MDCLIDFNSPKLKREDLPLIPGSFMGPLLNPFSVTGEESNPFDMVVCQVAANAAAENDPFERVLHDAINCPPVDKTSMKDEVKSSPGFSNLNKRRVRKSISLPDLRPFESEENLGEQETENIGKEGDNPGQHTQEINLQHVCSPPVVSREDHLKKDSIETCDAAEWNYLDDIPPPDSLLNSTVDMSCFLDDTLSANNASKHITKHGVPSVAPEKHQQSLSNFLQSQGPSKTSIKSEKEIILLAQKKIENIITKATLAVRHDIHDSIIQRRLSSQSLTPYQEALALCTPKRSKEVRPRHSIEPSLSVEEWSRREMKKLNIALPEPVTKSPLGQGEPTLSVEEWSRKEMMKLNIALPEPVTKSPASQALESDIDKICNFHNDGNISSEEMPAEDLSFSSPLKQVTTPKAKGGKSMPSDSEPQGKSTDFHTSPALLPLPLCEDAVRNLSLCSKYSPTRVSISQKNSSLGSTQSSNRSSQLEQNGKQTKLFLRKPPATSGSKMAPMKATAPIQNMTRTKSSLTTSAKPDLNDTARKTVSKMPQSPRCSASGSLPNLSSQGSKTALRLPSPRRSASMEKSIKTPTKRQTENRKEKNVSQSSLPTSTLNSSPRPIRKGSMYNRPGRVLADVNTTSSSRMTTKYKNNQPDTPRRGRSLVREKENFV